ncbi:MAG: AraC family transcriptional regulator [Lachnospiraceae bacterium]|nr:AraC family transcriptional regulator [Lachnospiraceae bacterium]
MNIIEYENYQEKPRHHDNPFPYLTYPCSIPQDFKQVPLHWHDEMELIYIKKGAGTVTLDFSPLKVSAGDIVIVCPGQLHSIGQLNQETMEYENIIFPLWLLSSRQPDSAWETYLAPIALRQMELPFCLRPGTPPYPAAAACLDEIDQVRRTFPKAFELVIKGKLFEFFFSLYQHGLVTLRPHADPTRRRSLEKSRQILKYIEQHYNETLSIKKLADFVGFSQSHFMKFFKHTFGLSFTAYLNDYRLTMASRLLLSSEGSVLAVASESGFENLSYFNRKFKERFGMTPREFRMHGQHPPIPPRNPHKSHSRNGHSLSPDRGHCPHPDTNRP